MFLESTFSNVHHWVVTQTLDCLYLYLLICKLRKLDLAFKTFEDLLNITYHHSHQMTMHHCTLQLDNGRLVELHDRYQSHWRLQAHQLHSSAMADELVGQMAMQHLSLLGQLQLLNRVKVKVSSLLEFIISPWRIRCPYIYDLTVKSLYSNCNGILSHHTSVIAVTLLH